MNEPLWERVQATFDARRDPLRDEELARQLAGAPDAELAEVLALRSMLGALEGARRRRRSILRVAAAAAGVAALGTLALVGGRSKQPETAAVSSEDERPAAPSAGRVLSLTMTTTTRAPHETRVARSDGRTLRRELRLAPQAEAADPNSGSILATRVVAAVTRPLAT